MLFATVSRGKNLGTRLFPHRFKDERYHVHLGKAGPFIPIGQELVDKSFEIKESFKASSWH